MEQRFTLSRAELDFLVAIVWLAIAIGIGLVAHRIVYWLFGRWAAQQSAFATAVMRRTRRPAAYIFPLLAILAVTPNLVLPEAWTRPTVHVTELLTIGIFAWTIVSLVRLWSDLTVARHRTDVEDNLAARQLGTRVDILSRVVVIIVWIVAIGMMLMTFPEVQSIGTALLASAGLAGIAVGFAARPLFENLVAGIQLALTQPIRLDDVVIIEKQYGRVEEIHSTYVVVRLWDLRRMVVPLAWFISTPFENWTRSTANLLGEVFVFADWTIDVAALRAEVPAILASTPLWDGLVQNVQVTDATERAVQIRALVSARNSGDLFDLRCYVREAIVAYLRDQQPQALPRTRREDEPGPRDGALARATASPEERQTRGNEDATREAR
ncbi:MAG: mechanosensitive ion channel [Candidatus Eremiobacteraeota bacterium]|nr:mechanosensitive ion channel [Candidatus Eremiobacteraeota bacterium]